MIRRAPAAVDAYYAPAPDYEPDTRVAARWNPYDSAPAQLGVPQHGPPNYLWPQAAPDKTRPSDEQGIGRAPGQDWPHMPHVFQFNPSEWHNFAWLDGGDPPDIARSREHILVNDRAPHWAEGLAWWQQQPQAGKHVWPGPVTVEPAPSVSFTQTEVLDLGGSSEGTELLGGGIA